MSDPNLDPLQRGMDPSAYPPHSVIEKLKTQNEKLRVEMREITEAMDEAVRRQRMQEKAKNQVPLHKEENPTETEKELQMTLGRINKLKREIAAMKKQLDGNLSDNKVSELENERHYLQEHIKSLKTENGALSKIASEQKKALEKANNVQNYQVKMTNLRSEAKSLRERYRELLLKQKEDEKVLETQHMKCVALEEKARKLKNLKLGKKKTEESDEPRIPEVTEGDINELNAKYQEEGRKKQERAKQLAQDIKDLEAAIVNSRQRNEILTLELKERDQECRLAALKARELKKAVPHNRLKPINHQSINSIYKEPSSYLPEPTESHDSRHFPREEAEQYPEPQEYEDDYQGEEAVEQVEGTGYPSPNLPM